MVRQQRDARGLERHLVQRGLGELVGVVLGLPSRTAATTPRRSSTTCTRTRPTEDWEIAPAILDGDPANLFAFFPTYQRGAMTIQGYREIVGDDTLLRVRRRPARRVRLRQREHRRVHRRGEGGERLHRRRARPAATTTSSSGCTARPSRRSCPTTSRPRASQSSHRAGSNGTSRWNEGRWSALRWIAGWTRTSPRGRATTPREIGPLFSDDARYRYYPYDPAFEGREAVVRSWLGENEAEEDARAATPKAPTTPRTPRSRSTVTSRSPPGPAPTSRSRAARSRRSTTTAS